MARQHKPDYTYKALVVERVIDGDTYKMLLDLGFGVRMAVKIRLHGWDTAELPSKEGRTAQEMVADILGKAQAIVVKTYSKERSFDRWVGDVYFDGNHLGEWLGAKKMAWPSHP